MPDENAFVRVKVLIAKKEAKRPIPCDMVALLQALKARIRPKTVPTGFFMSAAMFVTVPMICVFPFTGLISRAFDGYSFASWVLVSIAAAAGIGHFITYILVAFKTCNAVNALLRKYWG